MGPPVGMAELETRHTTIEDKYADRQLAGSIDTDFLSLMITMIKAMKNVCMNPKTAPAK